ncbi:MAG: ATP-binding protein, partial [Planctomycetota bacterium]
LVHAASLVAGAPISLISLVDEQRQWFKASVGLGDVRETPREHAFCAHTIMGEGPMEVEDAAENALFEENPLVTGDPGIRFYCGFPVQLSTGEKVGTLCVIDRVPRSLDAKQKEILTALSVTAASALEGRRAAIAVVEREKHLAKAHRDLDRVTEDLRIFVRLASHDMASPLVTIDRLAQWIEEDLPETVDGEIAENAGLIRTRTARLQDLLRDLRSYVMAGHDDESPSVVDVGKLIQAAVAGCEDASNCDFDVRGAEHRIACQEAQLALVLQNVIENSVRFRRPEGARIRVSAQQGVDGSLSFEVADNGPGISEAFHEAVFEPLRTLQSKDESAGSGIGLALVAKLVEANGGAVTLVSDGETGTTVRWTWPTAEFVGESDLVEQSA